MIYHTLFGNPRIFNQEAMRFLNLFDEELDIAELGKRVAGNSREILNDLIEKYYLLPKGVDERRILYDKREAHLQLFRSGNTIDHIGLSVSNMCNYGCNHCIFFSRNQHRSYGSRKMKWEIAKKCIDTYISLIRQNGRRCGRIIFGNAEPLLNWDIIEKILRYCEKVPDVSFEYAINTNLSLLTKDIAETLKHYRVRIATSLDGLQEVNDLIRVTKKGTGTFATINRKMDLLERIQYPLDGISITVTVKNFNSIDTNIIDYALNRGMTRIACDYDLVNLQDRSIGDRVAKILELKTYANKRGMIVGGTWSRPFEKLMNCSLLFEKYAFCAAAEGRMIVFDPDGGIKICGYSGTRIGHLDQFDDLFTENSTFYRLIENRLPGNNTLCKGCTIEGFCGGQCYPTMEAAQGCESLLKDMCLFYKTMTDALIKDTLSNHGIISSAEFNDSLGTSIINSNNRFNFLCERGLKCSKGCCSNVHILLPPYDLLRIRRRLGLSFEEFLQTYARVRILERIGLPVVSLKMRDDKEMSCPFLTPNGCSIYSDRPSICRYYPVIPKRRLGSIEADEDYYLAKWHNCLGVGKAKEWTVREWRDSNEILLYDTINNKWKELITTFASSSSSRKILKSSREEFKRFFLMASYDSDEFRRYVHDHIIPGANDVDDERLHSILEDEMELTQYAFQWLTSILNGKEVR
jgi:hypothetical protein